MIPISHSFDTIYIPVLLLCTGLLVFSGLRHKYPVPTVAVLTAFLMVLFVIGLKIIAYPLTEWGAIFSQSAAAVHHTKYLPGGILFVALGLVLLKVILKIRLSFLDSLIFGLPLIGILQRIDCLVSGCCYGTPTHVPWAVHYSSAYPAYRQQLSEGLISGTATSSLGVHPTQLYYIIGFLLVIAALALIRKKVHSPGSLALSGFILMALSRFIIEFFRQPVQNKFSSLQWAGVNLLQWIIAGLVVVSLLVLFYREKHPKPTVPASTDGKEYLWRSSIILFVSALLVWNFSRIMAYPEFILLQVLIAISIAVAAVRLFQKSIMPSLRYPAIATLFLAIILMSQKSTDTIPGNDSIFMPQKWWDIKASAGGGKYDQINYDCNGNETGRTPQHYSIVSGGVAYNYLKSRNQHLQAGLNLGKFYDTGNLLADMSSAPNPSSMNDMFINFINPYFRYDFRRVGFGFGYNFFLQEENPGLPSLYFRVLPRENFFFDANVSDNFYASGLAGVWQIGGGYGFGDPEKYVLRFGVSSIENKALGYIDGNFLIYNRLYMHTTLDFGNKIHGMMGLKYQVGRKR